MKPKKRKSEGLDLLPWHKEVMRGSQRLLNIRMAEKDWAHATHRLLEKVEDEVEMVEDGQQILLLRRRLILTTKLMQQLLGPPPPAILSADATSSYESVVYFIAKVALEDACIMVPSTGSDLSSTVDNRNQTPGELKLSERLGDKYLSKSKIIEDFTGRAKKLESDLLRTACKTLANIVSMIGEDLFSIGLKSAKPGTRKDFCHQPFCQVPHQGPTRWC
ncbi:hypothetical protein C5167_031235 [Papaver somniferum]|nr:hypothetical protein C5167_031235 [Papaver somniferum]